MSPLSAGPSVLSDDRIEYFARQIIVPGIGANGQRRLCAAEVLVAGAAEGRRIAARYLRAAGVQVHDRMPPALRLDCVVVAGTCDITPERLRTLIESAPVIAWYSLDGRTLRGGLADIANPVPERGLAGREPHRQDAQLLHRVGGADVATTAVSALLGWARPGYFYEVALD